MLDVARSWDGLPIPPEEWTRVEVAAVRQGLRILVDAPFHGDPPPPGPAGPTAGLWEHEVVELFVAGAAGPSGVAYTEVELSPHGHHLVLRLEGVRQVVESGLSLAYRARIGGRGDAGQKGASRGGGTAAGARPPGTAPRAEPPPAGRWRGEAVLPGVWLPAPEEDGRYRVNAFALHGAAGARRHLASHPLPGLRPDFHQPARFPLFRLPAFPPGGGEKGWATGP